MKKIDVENARDGMAYDVHICKGIYMEAALAGAGGEVEIAGGAFGSRERAWRETPTERRQAGYVKSAEGRTEAAQVK